MALGRHFLLHTGAKIPTIGLGTYLSQEGALQSALDYALFIGYRHIDTAYTYANEKEIGEIISSNIQAGKLKRKDLFITTKIPPVYLGESDIRPCAEESLDSLKMTYVDMLVFHSPWGLKNRGDGDLKPMNEKGEFEMVHHDILKAWKQIEAMVDDTKTRAIGLSNFTVPQIERIWNHSKIKPAYLQSECHGYLQQDKLRGYCASRSMAITGYSPLGSPGRPSTHQLSGDPVLLEDPTVQDIARKLKRTPAHILLRYLLQIGVIPIPKSKTVKRLEENIQLYDFTIGAEDLGRLKQLNCGLRYFKYPTYKAVNHPEFQDYEKEPF